MTDLSPRIIAAPADCAQPRGIAIVGPAGFAPDPAAFERGLARLAAQGATVFSYCEPDHAFQRFAASDEARCAQIVAASQHPEVDIIMALRGGYGVSRLLPLLDWAQLAAANKCWVGYSDVTAMHCALLVNGATGCFAGPMLCDDYTTDQPSGLTQSDFWACLHHPLHRVKWTQPGNPQLAVEGVLWGGNLAMLNHLLGTPWWPGIKNGILFVEDVSEHPYRVERMLLQLLYSGVLAQQQALVLGDFSGYRLGTFDRDYDFSAMLAFIRSQSPVPVLTGLPFGHCRDRVTLPLGGRAQLQVDGDAATLTVSGYRGLSRPA